jgi:hypothetical protein
MKVSSIDDQLQSVKAQAQKMQEARAKSELIGLTPPPVKGKVKSAPFTAWDMMLAINDVSDMCERCMFSFYMLGDLAKAVHDKKDSLLTDKIEVGIPEREMTVERKSLFKTWGFEETDFGFRYYFSPPTKWDIKIPVEIHIIKNKYKYFDNPDRGFFGTNDFLIPNKFEEYWKVRGVIR